MTIAEQAEKYLGRTKESLQMLCTEWCAEFVMRVIKDAEPAQISVTSISCNEMLANMRKSADWYEPEDPPKRGDVLFFDWDRIDEARPLDHVGIITGYLDGIVSYINGNGNSRYAVTKQTIDIDSLNLNEKHPCIYMRLKSSQEPVTNIVTIEGRKYRVSFEEV